MAKGSDIMAQWVIAIACVVVTSMATAANGYVFTKIADSQGSFATFNSASLNDSGVVSFHANQDDAIGGIYVWNIGSGIQTLVDDTGSFSGFEKRRGATVNNNQQVVFLGFDEQAGPGYWLGAVGGPIDVIAQSGTEGVFDNLGISTSLNDHGTVVFDGKTDTDTERIIYRKEAGNMAVPLIDDRGIFEHLYAPHLNNNGQTAFAAALDSGGGGIYRREINGSFTAVFDFTTMNIGALPMAINSDGIVAIRAQATGVRALYLGDGGEPAFIADNSGAYDSFWDFDINSAGDIAFSARLDGDPGDSLFTGPDPVANRLIGPGDELFGGTVHSLSFGDGLNDSGQIAFVYQLTNGEIGVAIASVPEPATVFLIALFIFFRWRPSCASY